MDPIISFADDGTLADHSAADAATWKLDPGKSKLSFSGTQTGTKFQGIFTRYDAAIDHLETSHIAVSVDLASATTSDKQRDTALPGKDWFDVAQFRTAKFEAGVINRKGADAYEAVGTLTLRDSMLRCSRHDNFSIVTRCAPRSVALRDGRVVLDTTRGTLAFDFLIFATGFTVDWPRRPELAALAPHVLKWRDRFAPADREFAQADHPFLGPDLEFLERTLGTAPWGSSACTASISPPI